MNFHFLNNLKKYIKTYGEKVFRLEYRTVKVVAKCITTNNNCE